MADGKVAPQGVPEAARLTAPRDLGTGGENDGSVLASAASYLEHPCLKEALLQLEFLSLLALFPFSPYCLDEPNWHPEKASENACPDGTGKRKISGKGVIRICRQD